MIEEDCARFSGLGYFAGNLDDQRDLAEEVDVLPFELQQLPCWNAGVISDCEERDLMGRQLVADGR